MTDTTTHTATLNSAIVSTAAAESTPASEGLERLLARSFHDARKLEDAYLNAVESGDHNKIKNARWRYMKSLAPRLSAAQRANSNLPKRRQTRDPAVLVTAARAFVPGKPIDETVFLRAKKKSSGGYRPITDPGLVRRTASETLIPIARVHYHAKAWQFHAVRLAVRKTCKALEAGHHHVRETDINNHFGSIDVDALPKVLPLEKGVIDHAVAARHLHVVPQGRGVTPTLIDASLRGIPQGLPIAPLVTQMVTSQLAWEDGPEAVMANYADNFIVMGKSVHRVDSATDALGAAIQALPGGKFTVKTTKTVHASEGFQFLGHHIQLVDGKVAVRPSNKNEQNYAARMKSYDDVAAAHLYKPGGPSLRNRVVAYATVGDMWVYARSWAGVFQECPSAAADLEIARNLVAEYCASMGVTFNELNGYVNPDAEWDEDGYEG